MKRANKIITDALILLGVPYAYRTFMKMPKPPYAVYYIDREDFGGSDLVCDIITSRATIELYTAKKDFVLEEKIEELLRDYTFSKSENYDYNDAVYVIVYEITIYTKWRI